VSTVKVKESKRDRPRTSVEDGSPYSILGYGPRIKRLTTWEPERWKQPRDPRHAGLLNSTREWMRFHSWKDRGNHSLNTALYFARDMARGNLSWGNFLVLAGPSGVGKTHLAQAIAWEWFDDGFTVMFTRVDDLLDYIREGYDDNTYHQRLRKIRQCALLVLDDLGTEHAKDWAGEKIDRVVDWRYMARGPMVVTTNAKSEDLLERVASRLSDSNCSVVVQIDAEGYYK
jgi:DNA replication protein DnaC